MHAILWPIVSWIFREVIIKFTVLGAIFFAISLLVPMAISFLGPYLGTTELTSSFGNLGSGVWYFLDFFHLGYGLPLVISAFVTRFLIRRLPVIG